METGLTRYALLDGELCACGSRVSPLGALLSCCSSSLYAELVTWRPLYGQPWYPDTAVFSFQLFQFSCCSSMRLSWLVSRAPGASAEGEGPPSGLCWLKASWCCLLVRAPSSSLLSDAQEELELVSMETTDSESCGHCGEGGLEPDADMEEEEEEEERVSLASMGSGGLWCPCSMLCSWLLLLIMLFMAFCISSSIRCFSLFGMRPNLTAEKKAKRQMKPRPLKEHPHPVCVCGGSPSLDMPTARHFLKRHCWQRLRLILMMVQFSIFRHFLYWMFCWMLLRKKPCGSEGG